MSDTWDYEVLLPASDDLIRAQFYQVMAAVSYCGFQPANPATGLISLVSHDGMNTLVTQDLEEAYSWLHVDGGGMTIWDAHDDLFLTFDPAGHRYETVLESNRFPDVPHFGSVTVSISGDLLHRGPCRAVELCNRAEAIFSRLCGSLRPSYGYSVNEDILELLSLHWDIHDKVARQHPPDVLPWLSYFDLAYYEKMHDWIRPFLITSPEIIEKSGVIVRVYKTPLEIDLDDFVKLNAKWRITLQELNDDE